MHIEDGSKLCKIGEVVLYLVLNVIYLRKELEEKDGFRWLNNNSEKPLKISFIRE